MNRDCCPACYEGVHGECTGCNCEDCALVDLMEAEERLRDEYESLSGAYNPPERE